MKKDKEIGKRSVVCKKTWSKIAVMAIVAMFVGSGMATMAEVVAEKQIEREKGVENVLEVKFPAGALEKNYKSEKGIPREKDILSNFNSSKNLDRNQKNRDLGSLGTGSFWIDFIPGGGRNGGYFEDPDELDDWDVDTYILQDDFDNTDDFINWATEPGIYSEIRGDQDLWDGTSAKGAWCTAAAEEGGMFTAEDSIGGATLYQSFYVSQYVDVNLPNFQITSATFYCDYKMYSTDFDNSNDYVYFNILLYYREYVTWYYKYFEFQEHSGNSDAPDWHGGHPGDGWCTDYWDPGDGHVNPNEQVNDYQVSNMADGETLAELLNDHLHTHIHLAFQLDIRLYGDWWWNKEWFKFWVDDVRIYCEYTYDMPPDACYNWVDADGDNPGTTINFDASCSSDDHGIVKYEWDWTNDGKYDHTEYDPYTSHDYGDANNHECKLRVTDTYGNIDTVVHTIHAVNLYPNACYDWSDADGDNPGTLIYFDASCSSDDHGIVKYEWDWTNDGIYDWLEYDPYTSHDYGDTDNHQCKLRVTDANGESDTVVHTVHAIDNPPNACYNWNDADGDGSGTTINFDASCSSDDHGINKYEWDWENDGTYDHTEYDPYTSHDYGDTDNHQCKLRVTDTKGQTDIFIDTVWASQPGNYPPNPPTNPDPPDGETDVPLDTTLSCYVSDPDGDSMDVSFYLDGDFVGMDSNVPDGSIAMITLQHILNYSHTYTWYAIASDGPLQTQSPTWSFTTEDKPEVWVLLVGVSNFSENGIVINGTTYLIPDGDRFNNDIWAQYRVLHNVYGIPRNNMRIYASQYEPSDQRPTDPDGDPTKANVIAGLNWLENNADIDDIVWIMMTDHGGPKPGDNPGIFFSDGTTDEIMYPSELGSEIKEINHDILILLLEHCRSGTFIPACNDTNHIIITAVDANNNSVGYEKDVDNDGNVAPEPTDGIYSYPDLFSHSWNPFMQFFTMGLEGEADFPWNGGNNDGAVSILEAFNYANWKDQADNAQLDDDGNGIANQPSDGYLASQVWLGRYNLVPSGFNCTISSDVDNKIFSPGSISFNITVDNSGNIDLIDANLSVAIIDSNLGKVVFNETHIIDVPSYHEIVVLIIWDSAYPGNFSVLITLYNDTQFINGKIYDFDVVGENNPPNEPSNPVPSYGATNVSIYTDLSCIVSDPEENAMDVTFYWSNGTIIGTDNNVPSGGTAMVDPGELSYSTTYSWYAIANDGEYTNQSDTWSFTTIEPLGNISEDFDASPYVPPTGWSVYQTGASNSDGWTDIYNDSGAYGSSHSGEHCAFHDDDIVDGNAVDWLVTPPITLPSNATLTFYERNYYLPYWYTYHGVWISTASGDPNNGDFVEIKEYNQSTESWTKRIINLSGYGGETVYIAFKYEGNYSTEWYIDDVNIIQGLLPIADFNWTPIDLDPDEIATFDASSSYDPDGGSIVLYEWDWNNDGTYDESHTSPTVTHNWSEDGSYLVTLRVTDDEGTVDTETQIVYVGVIFSEGFEDEWVPDSDGDLAPPGWEVNITNNENNSCGYPCYWSKISSSDCPACVHFGEYAAWLSYDNTEPYEQDEWLISPEIDLTNYTGTKLIFWSSFYGYNNPVDDHDYVKVYTETIGWKTIVDISFDYEDNHYDEQLEFDLSNYDGEKIKIAFNRHFMGPWNNYIHPWFVDDVTITGILMPVNYPPTLSNGSVSPISGDVTTTFTYQVKYNDSNGDAPITTYVYVDGSPRTMTKISGDYTTGAIFQYQTTLPEGSHNYYFLFNDGHNPDARLPVSGTYSGPSVSLFGIIPPIFEGFEDGIMPPDNWTVYNNNTDHPWTIVDAATYPEYVHNGDYAAWINYDIYNSSDNWLYTPYINLTGFTNMNLSFWAITDTNWPSATMKLHVIGDGFDDVIWDLIADENWPTFEYRQKTLSLDSYCGQLIKLAWQYVGIDGESFGLDDIWITGATLPEPPAIPSQPSGPTCGEPGVSYQYQTSTTDPDGDDIFYKFDWDDNSMTNWLGPYSSGEIVTASHSWNQPGLYYVRVKAKDENGLESDWSEPLPVEIGTVLLSTSFEDEWVDEDPDGDGYVVPATGWDVDGECNGNQSGWPNLTHYWSQYDNSDYPLAKSGNYCAGLWWSDGNGGDTYQNEWLITPAIDCSDYEYVYLSFYGIWYWDTSTKGRASEGKNSIFGNLGNKGGNHNYVKISTDNGSTWTILADLLNDPEYEQGTGGPAGYGWCWNEYKVILNLSSYADGESCVKIAWQAVNDSGGTLPAIFMIDDVAIVGTFSPSGQPQLSCSPTSHDFGTVQEGQTYQTTFEIWNSGTGTLYYNLSEDCDWVTVSPTSGDSTGEHDTIIVDIDTTGLSLGPHSCNISISSNGGSGTFTVEVNVILCEGWNCTLDFYAADKHDWLKFGEATDASDDQDSYDQPDPPPGPTPYIDAEFVTSMSYPYDKLQIEYKHYSLNNTYKEWNFTVRWLDSSSTIVNVTWNSSLLQNTEYTSIILYDEINNCNIDMLQSNYYEFTASSGPAYSFKIICSTLRYITDPKEGWNRIGLPDISPVNKSDLIVRYNNTNYTWNEAVNEGIVLDFIYDWDREVGGYYAVDTLESGRGYWMFAFIDCELWYMGGCGGGGDNAYITDPKGSKDGHQGWNLIGLPDISPVNKSDLIVRYNNTNYTWNEAVNEGIVLDFIYDWDRENEIDYAGDVIQPGRGYWLFAFYDIELYYNRSSTRNYNMESDIWNCTLDFYAADKHDWLKFREATDASDDQDSYDQPDPPPGPTPYIDAEFVTSMSYPYDKLQIEYKHYSLNNTYKEWNFTVRWLDSSSTIVNITWNSSLLQNTEYTSIILYDEINNCSIDMLQNNYYEFTASSGPAYSFKIICRKNIPPVAKDDHVNVSEDSLDNQIDVLANDYDNDSDVLSITSVSIPSHGTAYHDGSYVYYTPNTNYYGTDSFTYTITDGNDTDTAIVYVNVIKPSPDYIAITFSTKNFICAPDISTNFSFNAYASAFNNTYGFIEFINANWSISNFLNMSNATINASYGKCIEFNSGNNDGMATLEVEYNGFYNSTTFLIASGLFSFMLYQGWNLITIPYENNFTAKSLGQWINNNTPSSYCSIISKWNSTMQQYQSYLVGISPDEFNFNIEDGRGYFIYLKNDTIFSIDARIPIENVSVPLHIGWNLIGWFKENSTMASSLGESIENCSIVSKWNATMQQFQSYLVGISPPPYDFVIKEGMGIFIYTTKESIWHS